MPAVARMDPKEVFTSEEWARISPRSHWRGLVLVAAAWALILAAGAMFAIWPNPLTYVLAVMVIGARQLGLAILMHDAAHGALHANAGVNEWVGEWLCAAPTGARLRAYRDYHLKHHRYTEQPEDPDLGLSAPFPVTRASLGLPQATQCPAFPQSPTGTSRQSVDGALLDIQRVVARSAFADGLLVGVLLALACGDGDVAAARDAPTQHRRACLRPG